MKILFVKRALNTRLYNQILALHDRGHELSLLLESPVRWGYSGPNQWDEPAIHRTCYTRYSEPRMKRAPRVPMSKKAPQFRRVLEQVIIQRRPAIIISANDCIETEDERSRIVLELVNGRVPVVYDCQDFLVDCFPRNTALLALHRQINEHADGVIHTSPRGLAWVQNRCRIKKALTFPNYASRRFFSAPERKLSAADRRLHLVYAGGMTITPDGEPFPHMRDMRRSFREIARLKVDLHLHLAHYPREVYNKYLELADEKNVRFYPYQPYHQLMQRLSVYDAGLFPLDLGYIRACQRGEAGESVEQLPASRIDTSKQYEYVLAGLPVLTAPVSWVSEWVSENGVGACYSSIDELERLIENGGLTRLAERVREIGPRFAIENQIHSLEQFLADLV